MQEVEGRSVPVSRVFHQKAAQKPRQMVRMTMQNATSAASGEWIRCVAATAGRAYHWSTMMGSVNMAQAIKPA